MSKKSIFDTRPVMKAADKQLVAVLKRFGAFVRQTARQSLKKSKKPAAAGKPPHSHKGLIKRFLYFFVDNRALNVVIGPAKLNGAVSPNIPEALEKGGHTTVVGERKGKVKVAGSGRVKRVAKISPHPYMGPAAKKEKKHLPAIWAHSVRSS